MDHLLCTFVINPFFCNHCLQDGVAACRVLQCGLGSEERAANQVLRDRAHIHINPRTATLYRSLPLGEGGVQEKSQTIMSLGDADARGHRDTSEQVTFSWDPFCGWLTLVFFTSDSHENIILPLLRQWPSPGCCGPQVLGRLPIVVPDAHVWGTSPKPYGEGSKKAKRLLDCLLASSLLRPCSLFESSPFPEK